MLHGMQITERVEVGDTQRDVVRLPGSLAPFARIR
jgi:hypothetical protein